MVIFYAPTRLEKQKLSVPDTELIIKNIFFRFTN